METIEYKNPGLDRTNWPKGEWDNEPDKKQWQDSATGLPCLIVRNWSGALCGYVGVPVTHPLFGKDYNHADVEVHGGLTFADKCQDVVNECSGICHKAPEGEDNVWWFGFDCHHSGDIAPGDYDYLGKCRRMYDGWERYRNFSYVVREVTALAAQLKALETAQAA